MQIRFPPQIAPSYGGSGPPSNTWFLGPTQVHTLSRILIGLAIFARLKIVTDQPTDRPRYSIRDNKSHLHSSELRPNNKLCNIQATDGTN